jgi:hypothetical protein
MGIPVKLVKLLNATLTETSREIKIQNELTDIIIMRLGLKEGHTLAPLLLSLALKYVILQDNVDTNNTSAYKSSQIMAYADDILSHPGLWHQLKKFL